MYPRWLWPGFAFPGVLWLIILFVVPFYAVIGVAFGTVDPILLSRCRSGILCEWNVGWVNETLQRLSPGGDLWVVFVRTCEYVFVSLGLSWRSAIRSRTTSPGTRRGQEPAPDPAHPAVLDQLPDADAGLGEPARPGRVREPVPPVRPHHRPAVRLPRRPELTVILGAGLRLHPVSHPAAVRGARPDRQVAGRGGPRPRGEPVPRPSSTSRCRCRRPASWAAAC